MLSSYRDVAAVVVATGALMAGGLAVPAGASARAVPSSHRVRLNIGVSGAKIGDSEKAVRKALGKPTTVSPHCGESAQKTPQCVTWTYSKTHREIAFLHRKITYIIFGSKRDMTRSGIGLKAAKTTIGKSFPRCPSGFGYCFLHNKGTTDFPKSMQLFSFVNFSNEKQSGHVNRFIIGRYEPRYDDCIFGCG